MPAGQSPFAAVPAHLEPLRLPFRAVTPVTLLLAFLLAATPAEGGNSAGWPEIPASALQMTRLAADPQADAVVLLKERHGRILKRADDWVNVMSHHLRMKILTDAGKRYAETEIRATRRSRVSNIRARTVRPDGSVVPVAEDRIFERVLYKTGDYNVSDWVFSFPAVEPGVIIEYTYDRHDDYLFYIPTFYFEGPEHTLKARVTQGVPKKMGYSILCENCPPGMEPEVTKWREGKAKGEFIEFELTGLPGYREEVFMPPRRDASARLEMVLLWWEDRASFGLGRQDDFFTDWNSVARFAGTYYDRAVERGLTRLKPHVERWTEGLSGRDEKIEAVLGHIREGFQYLEWWSIGGWVRPIPWILESRVVDNEERAVLLLAALELLDVEALPALVGGRHHGDVNPKFFSMAQFSHVMVALPGQDGSYEWIDPSLTYAPVEFGSWRNSGATALLIRGRQGELIQLPKRVERSLTKYDVELALLPEGQAELDLEVEFTGEDAVEARSRWAPMAERPREEDLRDWLDENRPGMEILAHEFSGLEDLDVPLRLSLSLRAPGIVTRAAEVILAPACLLTGYTTNPISMRERVHPLYVDRGWNIQETVIIRPAEGIEAVEIPPPTSARSGVGRMSLRCSELPDGGARCRRSFIARRGRWHARDIQTLRAMFNEIVEADGGQVVFRREEPADLEVARRPEPGA